MPSGSAHIGARTTSSWTRWYEALIGGPRTRFTGRPCPVTVQTAHHGMEQAGAEAPAEISNKSANDTAGGDPSADRRVDNAVRWSARRHFSVVCRSVKG